MAVLNIILMIGYAIISCIVGGQILSAVSGGGMSVVVGIVIVAFITWLVAVFGMIPFSIYERSAFVLVEQLCLAALKDMFTDSLPDGHGYPKPSSSSSLLALQVHTSTPASLPLVTHPPSRQTDSPSSCFNSRCPSPGQAPAPTFSSISLNGSRNGRSS